MKIDFLRFSREEIIDLVKSWLAVSAAFAIAMSGLASEILIGLFVISAITVGLGFLLHELAHKFLAQKYGCFAEFRSNNFMLVLALALSFTGFVFAAPGGVVLKGYVNPERYGRISAAGVAANLVLALLFLILFFTPFPDIGYYGFYINSWLALFNLIPVGSFDGLKILNWNKKVYAIMIVIAFSLIAVKTLVFQ